MAQEAEDTDILLRGAVLAGSANLVYVLVRQECEEYFGNRAYHIVYIETEKHVTIGGKTVYGKSTFLAEAI